MTEQPVWTVELARAVRTLKLTLLLIPQLGAKVAAMTFARPSAELGSSRPR
jgi:hypothetical protein